MSTEEEDKLYQPTKHQYIFKYTRNKRPVYYFRGTVRGRFIERSLKTNKITVAVDEANEIRKDPGLKPKQMQQTFNDAFDYLVDLKKAEGHATYEQIRHVVNNHLRPWFNDNCPFLKLPCDRYLGGFLKEFKLVWANYKEEASKRKIPSYIYRIKDEEERAARITDFLLKNSRPRKLEHDRRFLVEALQRAFDAAYITKRFTEKSFNLLESHDEIGQYVEDDRVKTIVDGLKANPKNLLQVLMAVTMAMRKAEILKIKKTEINWERREINLDAGRLKTRKRRGCPIPISDDVYPLLKQFYEESTGIYIFPSLYRNKPGRPFDYNKPQVDNKRYWNKVRKDTGIHIRFHDLRHTAITNMIKAGIPDTMIEKICGVTREVMRRIYAHLDQEVKTKFQKIMAGRYI